MKTNAKGIKLIKSFESCRLVAYKDGGGVWTIGWGHTRGVTPGQKITQEQADSFLRQDLKVSENAVDRVLAPLTPNQFSALVSLVYNIGTTAFENSTLLKVLNKGQYDKVPSEIKRWNHDNGKIVSGLTRRREAEAALFETKPFHKTNTGKVTIGGGAVVSGAAVADAVNQFTQTADSAHAQFSTGDIFGLVLGGIILLAGLYVIYTKFIK